MHTDYRKTLEAAIGDEPKHPMHHNVQMQVHHLLSRKGVKKARLITKLKFLGYDINDIGNLVSLPCTVQGACHLKVQLHCGDHTAKAGDPDTDDEPASYHFMVKSLLLRNVKMKRWCDYPEHVVQTKMNALSRKMLWKIKMYTAPLTSVSRNFRPLNKRGCCQADSVEEARRSEAHCAVNRNHYMREGAGQREEEIQYRGTYFLRAGH